MSKKSFKTSFDNLLGGGKKEQSASMPSLKYKETKATFVVRNDHLDKLKAIAFFERKMIKDVLCDALSNYIDGYEKVNGTITLPKI